MTTMSALSLSSSFFSISGATSNMMMTTSTACGCSHLLKEALQARPSQYALEWTMQNK
ncbi:hypothetical protein CY35_08G038400 [Sphagnum magellanicum]|nr:hypothetical protein CY35_08G038400 [Sphagnum magellanicum]